MRLAGLVILAVMGVGAVVRGSDFEEAVGKVGADDFQERARAVREVQGVLERQMIALMGAGGSDGDSETSAGIGVALREHLAFTEFLAGYLRVSPEVREGQLKLVGQAEVLGALENVFSDDPAKRTAGMGTIATMTGHDADVLLAALINAPQRRVSLAAMEAAWDRKACGPVTEALWNRAVGLGMKWSMADQEKLRETYAFRGEVRAVDTTHQFDALRDDQAAGDVLIHIQDPSVNERIVQALREWHAAQVEQKKPGQFQMAQGMAQQNVKRLLMAYRPADAVTEMLAYASEPVRWTKEYAEIGYCDNRSDWVALCGELVGADLSKAKMKIAPTGESVYKFATDADEEAAVGLVKERANR